MKVSIIIPVYNAEEYLKQCLESVFSQTHDNIEVVIVNDGSKDKSEIIIKNYLKKHKNIKYFKQENSGQSKARNKGLENATGDLIMFVDADDFIDETMIEKLIKPFEKDKQLEMTFCDYYLFSNESLEKDYIIKRHNIDFKKALILSAPSPCMKLIKKSRIIDFRFPENMIYEDFASMPVLLASIKKASYVQEHLYYYRYNNNSTTRDMSYGEKKLDIIKASEELLNRIKRNKEFHQYIPEIEFLIIQHLIIEGGLRFCRYPDPKKKLKMISTFILKNVKDYNKNIYFSDLTNEQKKIVKMVMNNNVICCYLYLMKRKLKRILKVGKK